MWSKYRWPSGIYVTEFGYGESGAPNTKSRFQCYSQPGRIKDGVLIPDRHRSEVKGAWLIRGILYVMEHGINLVNIYSTECEKNFWGTGQWDDGAGLEMFKWRECDDTTPGAKVAYVEPFVVKYARDYFATTGIFGQILGNGA